MHNVAPLCGPDPTRATHRSTGSYHGGRRERKPIESCLHEREASYTRARKNARHPRRRIPERGASRREGGSCGAPPRQAVRTAPHAGGPAEACTQGRPGAGGAREGFPQALRLGEPFDSLAWPAIVTLAVHNPIIEGGQVCWANHSHRYSMRCCYRPRCTRSASV